MDIVSDTRVMCSQSGEQGGSGVKLDLENIHHIYQSGKYQLIEAMNSADMRKPLVPGAEGMCIVKTLSYQAGGEGGSKLDSEKLNGKHSITQTKPFSSPTSKKVTQKSRSVASTRRVFSSDRGAGGSADVNGGQHSEKRKIEENNILVDDRSQNWRQKLLEFRPEES